MSAADKRLKDKAEKRLKAKPKKAENQKRVCQKFMTHPLFLFHQSFFFIKVFSSWVLLLQNLQILIEPDIHLIGSSMIPSIIRNQGELLILHGNLAISSLIEHLGIGLDSLH